jgi:hypothetical protein
MLRQVGKYYQSGNIAENSNYFLHKMWNGTREYYDQLFVFKNSKTYATIVCSKNIKPHFIGKKLKHSTFEEYIVHFPIPTPISDGVLARVSFSHGFVNNVH